MNKKISRSVAVWWWPGEARIAIETPSAKKETTLAVHDKPSIAVPPIDNMSEVYETAASMFRERLLLAKDTDFCRAWLVSTLGHLGEMD